MDEAEIREAAAKEARRLTGILRKANVSKGRMDMLRTVIENTAWMKVRLDDTREVIRNTQIANTYDNGGGQKGLRENPLFKGYESLWKSYMLGMGRILDALPAEAMAEAEAPAEAAPKSVLALVRARHERDA